MRYEDCRFGLVVRHGSYGIGMIEVLVPKNQTVIACFETEAVNLSPGPLQLLGDIRIFEAVPMMARAMRPEAPEAKSGRIALPEN